jgi:hypothetical protein
MTLNLETVLGSVIDEQPFLRFLQALAEDWGEEQKQALADPGSSYGPGANGWENGTIGAYPDAAGKWDEASVDGLEFYEKSANPWRRSQRFFTWEKSATSRYGPALAHFNVRHGRLQTWVRRHPDLSSLISFGSRQCFYLCSARLRSPRLTTKMELFFNPKHTSRTNSRILKVDLNTSGAFHKFTVIRTMPHRLTIIKWVPERSKVDSYRATKIERIRQCPARSGTDFIPDVPSFAKAVGNGSIVLKHSS